MNEEYVVELYNFLSGTDDSFQNDVSQEQFLTDMQSKQYAAQIYQYLGDIDESFKSDVDINQFLLDIGVESPKADEPLNPQVKKKDGSLFQ